jgi:tryptophan synthase alpha chain
MNRITKKFEGDNKLLSIYFTAGYPKLDDTCKIIEKLEASGVDIVEIGLPFSDPLAEGTTIQKSSKLALANGMSSDILFNQLKNIRKKVNIPLIIMGYFNPILQYGVDNFCKKCKEIGIDGLIIPDLPVKEYLKSYESIFKKNSLLNIFLITPQTNNDRIKFIDSISTGFIYMVSSSSITGVKDGFNENQLNYFKKIKNMNLKSPKIIGFGISDSKSFNEATSFSRGAIIGSAFINFIESNGIDNIKLFIKNIKVQ